MTEAVLAVQNRDERVVGGIAQPFERDVANRWVAHVYAGYRANTIRYQPDAARFQLFRGAQQGPFAIMTITYSSQVSANILGPDAVAPGTMATWNADVVSGTPPFEYHWYRNWEFVGHGASYATTVGNDPMMELRLDVYDAEGHAASVVKPVMIHGCDPSMIVC